MEGESPYRWLSLDIVLSDLRLSATQRLHHTPWMNHARRNPNEFLMWLHAETGRRVEGVSRTVPLTPLSGMQAVPMPDR